MGFPKTTDSLIQHLQLHISRDKVPADGWMSQGWEDSVVKNEWFWKLFRDAMFFVQRTKHPVDGIRSAVSGFVVVADLHLAEQPDGEQVQSAEQQAESQHHQRPVRTHDGNVAQELLYPEPGYDGAATEEAEEAEGSEEV